MMCNRIGQLHTFNIAHYVQVVNVVMANCGHKLDIPDRVCRRWGIPYVVGFLECDPVEAMGYSQGRTVFAFRHRGHCPASALATTSTG